LRIAGTLALLAREIDGKTRGSGPGDGLGIAELSVLRQIERGNDLPSKIARELRLDPARVTRITDSLVALGYVERGDDPADRRRCRLTLTGPGIERVLAGRAEIGNLVKQLLASLTDDERASLTRGLEAVRRGLEAEAIAPASR
jgi:DNA-binding MarR family transcriptional regulator